MRLISTKLRQKSQHNPVAFIKIPKELKKNVDIFQPDEDIVYVTIDGIDGDMLGIDDIEIANEGRLVTATIHIVRYTYDDNRNEVPESEDIYEIAIRENEDQTYTIVSTSVPSI